MMLVAVASGLVSDAMSNSVSVVIGSTFGSTARLPYACSNTMPSRRPISTTHPDSSPRSIARVTAFSIRPSIAESMPAFSHEIFCAAAGVIFRLANRRTDRDTNDREQDHSSSVASKQMTFHSCIE